MSPARKLLAEALQLNEAERATLALQLMDSVSPQDHRNEASWLEEIERRTRRAVTGEEPGLDVDEALDGMCRDLGL